MPFGVGPWELVIVVVVLALLFGSKGIPDAAKRMGRGLREMRGAIDDLDPRKALEAPREPPREPPRALPPGEPARTPDHKPERDDI